MKFARLAGLVIALAAGFGAAAQAQDFPGKPMKFIVPVGTGGLSDLMGRLLSQHLSARVGQPVIVENLGGSIATPEEARAILGLARR